MIPIEELIKTMQEFDRIHKWMRDNPEEIKANPKLAIKYVEMSKLWSELCRTVEHMNDINELGMLQITKPESK